VTLTRPASLTVALSPAQWRLMHHLWIRKPRIHDVPAWLAANDATVIDLQGLYGKGLLVEVDEQRVPEFGRVEFGARGSWLYRCCILPSYLLLDALSHRPRGMRLLDALVMPGMELQLLLYPMDKAHMISTTLLGEPAELEAANARGRCDGVRVHITDLGRTYLPERT
jgi:hypothetical protein